MLVDDTGIRKELRHRTGWSAQNLSNRVSALRQKGHLMSRQHALYVLAYNKGVDLEGYGVTDDTLIKVGQLSRSVSPNGETQTHEPRSQRRAERVERRVSVSVDGADLGVLPSFVARYAGEADKRSAKAYLLMYLLEQSVREVISQVLSAEHGDSWWDQAIQPAKRKKAESRQKDDDQDPWHTPRGDHPLKYLDIRDYAEIIVDAKNWPLFEAVMDRPEFVTEMLREINVSRRVVAHMNPLNRDDFRRLETTFRKWMKHLKAREAHLPRGHS